MQDGDAAEVEEDRRDDGGLCYVDQCESKYDGVPVDTLSTD